MKKMLLLIITLLCLTGCGAKPISDDKTNETSYYIQDSRLFDIFVDKETCIEYILYDSGYKGGIIPRLNVNNTLKLNEICLKDEGKNESNKSLS